MPAGSLRRGLQAAAAMDREQPQPFFFESALDGAYFQELVARAAALPQDDRELIEPMVFQEIDIFHLRLAMRARFLYGLAPDLLLPLHVKGTKVSRERFAALLADPDLPAAAQRLVGIVVDLAPPQVGAAGRTLAEDIAALEGSAWTRFLRLANRAFRRSHMGLGAIVGYVGLRRVEVANLITAAEGIRTGASAEALRARLLPHAEPKVAHA
jgi:vacuolar-type H+-ATPase subunit C/Vma6